MTHKPAKTVIFSDLHLHNHAWKATILPSGRNSRLQHGVDAAMQVIDQVNEGDTLIFAGDWYEDQRSIPLSAIDATRDLLAALLARNPARTFFLVGNHDQFSRDGLVHSVGLFDRPSDNLRVIDVPTVTDGWAFLPFRRPPDLPGALSALNDLYEQKYPDADQKLPLVCHVDLIGGAANAGHLSSKGLRLSDFPSWASVILSGHYHKHQVIGDRFMFVGSPYQLTAGEAGEVKVWVSCEGIPSSLSDLEAHPFTGLPRFVEIPAPDWKELPDAEREDLTDNDFVTVVVPHGRRLSSLPEGVAQKPLPKPSMSLTEAPASGTITGALGDWLVQRGRPDLTALGLTFLT